MVTDLARTKAHFFLDTLKKEIRKISTSVTPKTENGNSTVAYPILMVRGNDNGLFNRIKDYMLKYDKYMTCEDKRTNGYLVFKFKVSDDTESFLFSYGEENSNSNNQENASSSPVVSIDPKSRLDSLKSLLRKAGMRFGLHCSDVRFANDEAQSNCIATIYNCSKTQGERTMYYLLEAGVDAHVGSKLSITLVNLPNEADYTIFFKDELGTDCFPTKAKIDEEQRALKGGTEDALSDGKPGEVKVTDNTNATPGTQVPNPTVVAPQQSVAPVAAQVIPEPIVMPNSAQMQMARLAYEQLSGTEKVAFLHEYGKSLIPDEEEIVNRRKPEWEKQYASQFENELRNTMADEVFQNAEAAARDRLTPILRNALRPEVLEDAKKNAFAHIKELLTKKFKSRYSIVPADGTWKVRTAHNGTIIVESTISIEELMKEIDLKNVVA